MYRSEKCQKLFEVLTKMGLPEPFCEEMIKNLRTDYTAGRMLGYLYRYPNPGIEELVDEMLAIISDRDRFVEKKKSEHAQATYNRILNEGLSDEEEWLNDFPCIRDPNK